MKIAQMFALFLIIILIFGCVSQEQKEANASLSTNTSSGSMDQSSRGLDLVSEEPLQKANTATGQSPAGTDGSQNPSKNQTVTSPEGGQIVDVGGSISIR